MKNTLLVVALLAFAPLAHAQETGRWETRVVTETTPGHWENRAKQVWQEPRIEIESRKAADGTIEHVKVEYPGRWKTVTERVWIEPQSKKVEKRVWVSSDDYAKPWDDAPRAGRTEQPTATTPSARTERPTQPRAATPAPAPRASRSLPAPTERVTSDPFELGSAPVIEQRSSVTPAPTYERSATVERDPLVFQQPAPPPAPEPARVVYVQQPQPAERVIVVREPAPAPRVVYVQEPCAPRVYVSDSWARRSHYYRDCDPVYVGPRVRVGVGFGVGVGVRVSRHVGVGVRVGF